MPAVARCTVRCTNLSMDSSSDRTDDRGLSAGSGRYAMVPGSDAVFAGSGARAYEKVIRECVSGKTCKVCPAISWILSVPPPWPCPSVDHPGFFQKSFQCAGSCLPPVGRCGCSPGVLLDTQSGCLLLFIGFKILGHAGTWIEQNGRAGPYFRWRFRALNI